MAVQWIACLVSGVSAGLAALVLCQYVGSARDRLAILLGLVSPSFCLGLMLFSGQPAGNERNGILERTGSLRIQVEKHRNEMIRAGLWSPAELHTQEK